MEDVTVTLTLQPAWSFSPVYPSCSYDSQSIRWTVDAYPDGTLLDTRQGIWATIIIPFLATEIQPATPLTPPESRHASPDGRVERFNPSHPVLRLKDSVLLSIDKVPVYLDHALKVLALHTEARTSFITYWLPSLLKHKYIALKFLPQQAYETAAPLTVLPRPDVVTRIFMLFRGVEEKDLAEWTEAYGVRCLILDGRR